MAIRTGSATANPIFSMALSGTTTVTGIISWSSPSLPDGAVITSQTLIGTPTYSGKGTVSTMTVNGVSASLDTQFSINLGTTLVTSVQVSAKGMNKNSTGTLSINNMTYTVNYQYDDGVVEPPVITIQSQDKNKISSVSGYDRCAVSFTADQALSYWEARATISGVTPAHGVGLLVESGTLGSGETGYVYVDDEELTNGDVEYTVTIFGQNADGVWSDE